MQATYKNNSSLIDKNKIMNHQLKKAQSFKALHQKGDPLIIYNIWDAGSAREVESAGAKAIGTSSWAVAKSKGVQDGEHLPLSEVLFNVERIMTSVKVPVTIDIEGGYGKTPAEVSKTIEGLIKRGIVGVSFEDQIIGEKELYSSPDQCDRIRAIRAISNKYSMPIFINATTNLFFKEEKNHVKLMDEAFERLEMYHKAGADGFFVPGLSNEILIKDLCENSPIPINIAISDEISCTQKLKDLGISRISHGPRPYIDFLNALKSIMQTELEGFCEK
ncbi:hypothetical protein AYO37_01255 [Opitutia bacterium SCGC AG-212-L18]|nr:hypothetical protein AYO37_01255 [Opitutae bacterium SCGC AG-212-L18]